MASSIALVTLLTVMPTLCLAGSELSDITERVSIARHTLNTGESDFTQQAPKFEVEDRQEMNAMKLKMMLARAQSEAEDQNGPHVDYSPSLLATAQELLNKHVPNHEVEEASVKAALEESGSLRDSVSAHMDTGSALNEAKLMLFERAKAALGSKEASLLEKTTARKDATPCVHVLEEVNGFPMADFDGPAAMDFEGMTDGAAFMNWQQCTNNCMRACKTAMMQGAGRFKIDPDEMAAMGMSQREIMLVGPQPQIGSKCDNNMCSCLDATQTKQKVMSLYASGMQIDLTKDEPFEVYPDEMICMDACRDEPGLLEGYGIPVTFQGVCLDEAFSSD